MKTLFVIISLIISGIVATETERTNFRFRVPNLMDVIKRITNSTIGKNINVSNVLRSTIIHNEFLLL